MNSMKFPLVLIALITVFATTPAQAAVDKVDSAISNWLGEGTSDHTVLSADSGTYVRVAFTRRYAATTGLIASHAKRESGAGLQHYHSRYALGNGTLPSKTDIDRYWDYRFGTHLSPGYPTRAATANLKDGTCHEYAFTASAHADGVYDKQILMTQGLSDVLNYDLAQIDPIEDVQMNDILEYGDGHSTLVSAVHTVSPGEREPSQLKWTFLESGLYVLTRDTWSTPMMEGIGTGGKKLCDQGWTWNWDAITNNSSDLEVYADN